MRAKTINESSNRLMIYRNIDRTYEAVRDSVLYSFMWMDYKVYNFRKVGEISPDYTLNGTLLKYPHIQMILQVQRNINTINEESVLKPKNLEGFHKEFYDVIEDLKSVGFKIVNINTRAIDKGYSNITYNTKEYPHYNCDIYHIDKSLMPKNYSEVNDVDGWGASFYKRNQKSEYLHDESWENLFIQILEKLYKQEYVSPNNVISLISNTKIMIEGNKAQIIQHEQHLKYYNKIKNILDKVNFNI